MKTVLAFILILGLSESVLAQPTPERVSKGIRELNLSAEQKRELHQLMEERQEGQDPRQLMDGINQLRRMVYNGASEEEIDNHISRIRHLAKERATRARKFKEILTPEQQERLKNMRQERRRAMAEEETAHRPNLQRRRAMQDDQPNTLRRPNVTRDVTRRDSPQRGR